MKFAIFKEDTQNHFGVINKYYGKFTEEEWNLKRQ